MRWNTQATLQSSNTNTMHTSHLDFPHKRTKLWRFANLAFSKLADTSGGWPLKKGEWTKYEWCAYFFSKHSRHGTIWSYMGNTWLIQLFRFFWEVQKFWAKYVMLLCFCASVCLSFCNVEQHTLDDMSGSTPTYCRLNMQVVTAPREFLQKSCKNRLNINGKLSYHRILQEMLQHLTTLLIS